MIKSMIRMVKGFTTDEFYTPDYAVYPLFNVIKNKLKGKIVWECTDNGNSGITRVLKKNGINVISTHINDGIDFLNSEPDLKFDLIITNPPYRIKNAFLERAYEIGKPFAFLLPITSLSGVKRVDLFKKYGIQLLVLNRRVEFLGNKRPGVWFNSSWFCWNLLPKDLMFAEVIR